MLNAIPMFLFTTQRKKYHWSTFLDTPTIKFFFLMQQYNASLMAISLITPPSGPAPPCRLSRTRGWRCTRLSWGPRPSYTQPAFAWTRPPTVSGWAAWRQGTRGPGIVGWTAGATWLLHTTSRLQVRPSSWSSWYVKLIYHKMCWCGIYKLMIVLYQIRNCSRAIVLYCYIVAALSDPFVEGYWGIS